VLSIRYKLKLSTQAEIADSAHNYRDEREAESERVEREAERVKRTKGAQNISSGNYFKHTQTQKPLS